MTKTSLNRCCAMRWWNNLSSLTKTQICDTHTELIGSVRRWETLTGSEIEKLWDDNNDSDKEIINEAFKGINIPFYTT